MVNNGLEHYSAVFTYYVNPLGSALEGSVNTKKISPESFVITDVYVTEKVSACHHMCSIFLSNSFCLKLK